MKITVKSFPENWDKEKSGERLFTTRKLDGRDTIEIVNTKTGDTFTRKITDIAVSKGEIIISFKRPKIIK